MTIKKIKIILTSDMYEHDICVIESVGDNVSGSADKLFNFIKNNISMGLWRQLQELFYKELHESKLENEKNIKVERN